MFLDAFSRDLRCCAACHDQCLFATAEVFATGRQTYATSRKALLLEAVRRGDLTWTVSLVDVIYAALSSGIQHAFCVHSGDPVTWPDETLYIRAARAEIVRARLAPSWATQLRDAWRESGNPYGLSDHDAPARAGETIFVFDAATRAFQPHVPAHWIEIADHFKRGVSALTTGTTGFELFDLGFVEEARSAAAALHARLASLRPELVLSESPEAVYMMDRIWPHWDLKLDAPVRHAGAWLASLLSERPAPTDAAGPVVTFQDPAYLVRYLGESEAPRSVLQALGVRLVEMFRHHHEAPPTGSYYGTSVGDWVRTIALERRASARIVGADAIITASPFDYRNLRDTGTTRDLGEIAGTLVRADHV